MTTTMQAAAPSIPFAEGETAAVSATRRTCQKIVSGFLAFYSLFLNIETYHKIERSARLFTLSACLCQRVSLSDESVAASAVLTEHAKKKLLAAMNVRETQ